MYKKYLAELIGRLLDNEFNACVYDKKITINKEFEIIYFECSAVIRTTSEFVTYNGYLGTVGNLAVTEINNKRLENDIRITFK